MKIYFTLLFTIAFCFLSAQKDCFIKQNCNTCSLDTLNVLGELILKEEYTSISEKSSLVTLHRKNEHLDRASIIISNECFFKYLNIDELKKIFGTPQKIILEENTCTFYYLTNSNSFAILFTAFKYEEHFYISAVNGTNICS